MVKSSSNPAKSAKLSVNKSATPAFFASRACSQSCTHPPRTPRSSASSNATGISASVNSSKLIPCCPLERRLHYGKEGGWTKAVHVNKFWGSIFYERKFLTVVFPSNNLFPGCSFNRFRHGAGCLADSSQVREVPKVGIFSFRHNLP